MSESVLSEEGQGKIVVFGGRQIRRAWVDDQWFFSVVDIVASLTDSGNPRDYWYRMKRREKESSGVELSTLCRQPKLTSSDGKNYKTEAVSTEAAFRVIQSIPSAKAEPFKRRRDGVAMLSWSPSVPHPERLPRTSRNPRHKNGLHMNNCSNNWV
ncbi:MAG: Bro-N domain-containing protein [Capsulimonadaceae bacterium]